MEVVDGCRICSTFSELFRNLSRYRKYISRFNKARFRIGIQKRIEASAIVSVDR